MVSQEEVKGENPNDAFPIGIDESTALKEQIQPGIGVEGDDDDDAPVEDVPLNATVTAEENEEKSTNVGVEPTANNEDVPLKSTDEEDQNTGTNDDDDPNINEKQSPMQCFLQWLGGFYTKNSFLILVLIVILLAYAYPPLGAVYLAPQVTATWIAVMVIFLLSGISLKSEELSKAFQRIGFNSFVQSFNFFVVSSITFGFSRLMIEAGVLPRSLADGLVIGTSVPITVNMVLVLTKSSNGDEAAAIFNAAFGSLIAVFLSPALILMYLGVKGAVDLGTVFYKLAVRVVLPIAIGQIFHNFSPRVCAFVKDHKPKFKKVQEYCLIFIIYTVFCKTFTKERDTSAGDIFIMIALEFLLLTFMMALAWYLLKLLFPNAPKLRKLVVSLPLKE